jgi:DNA-binding response OmpR family regulator
MPAARPVLIVEDDHSFRQVLAETVEVSGLFQATEASTLRAAMRHLTAKKARFDAIILDVNLPDGNGRDFCAKVRTLGHRMPIIMLSGSSCEDDVIQGFNAGANDYVIKPFRLGEFLARLRAQLRTFDNSEDAVFTIGPYRFHPAAKLLVRADTNQRIRLTSKEVSILKYFYCAGNQVTSRQVLLDEVWGCNAGASIHSLETHIYRLRQKIETDPTNFCFLVTAPGGYRLNAAAIEDAGTTSGGRWRTGRSTLA